MSKALTPYHCVKTVFFNKRSQMLSCNSQQEISVVKGK